MKKVRNYISQSTKESKEFIKHFNSLRIPEQDLTVNNLYTEDFPLLKRFLKSIGVSSSRASRLHSVSFLNLFQCVGIHTDDTHGFAESKYAIIYVVKANQSREVGYSSLCTPQLIVDNKMLPLYTGGVVEFNTNKPHGLMTNSRVKLAVFFFNRR